MMMYHQSWYRTYFNDEIMINIFIFNNIKYVKNFLLLEKIYLTVFFFISHMYLENNLTQN